MDKRASYIIPRVNPDGAEICLKEPFFEWIGSGLYMPGEEQFGDGLHYQDVNGDGIIVDMRFESEKGEWKTSDKDPRLMVPREPDEYGGTYYRRMVPEGMVEGFGTVDDVPEPRDGNLNRNYPYFWGPAAEQYGAGEYPMSEPEIASIVWFVLDHPNIAGVVNFHTHGAA